MADYQKERRRKNPAIAEKNRLAVLARHKELRAYTRTLKDKPCTDCGVKYPPYVMHFDHKDPALKEFGIAKLRSRARTDEEIKKCDVVCANCHAERTFGPKYRLDML